MARHKVVSGRDRKVNGKANVSNEELPSDDEIEQFHKQEEKLHLDPADDDVSDKDDEGELEDEAVYNLVDSDDVSNDEEDDDEDDSDEEEDKSGRLAQLKKQERLLRAKLQLQQGEDDDREEDEEEGEEDEDVRWGAKKRAYYDAEEELDDEDALREEAAEARRLQRQAAEALQAEDFEAGADLETDEDDEEAERAEKIETLGQRAEAAGQREAVEVEEVERDLGAISVEEQRAAVMADAPELAALLADLQSSLAEVRSRVGPLLKEIRQGQLATAEGVSYLEAKHLLLLQYCIHLVFYFLLKAEGRPVQNHPVIARLVEIRAFLERARPIDKRLKYQMDKLLAAAAAVQVPGEDAADGAATTTDDPLRYGPRPEELVPRTGAAADGAAASDGVYRPPKLNPAAMEDDPDRDYNKKARRREAELKRKAARSGFVQELMQEIQGAPEEMRTSAVPGEEAAGMARARARLEARAAQEEELMTRVPLSKAERKNIKAQRRAGLSGGTMLDDFADDITGLVQVADGINDSGIDPSFLNARVSQKFGADLSAAGRKNVLSGDADLPLKAPLHERRAKLDDVRAKQARARDVNEDDSLPMEVGGGGGHKRKMADFGGDEDEEDDEFYVEAAAASRNKKATRKEKYAAPPTYPALPDDVVEGARPVNRAVEKNRGLTPHRRKDIKNPRVKKRMQFDKKTKARRGQVQDVRSQVGSYGGEATGIKAGVAKSRRFG